MSIRKVLYNDAGSLCDWTASPTQTCEHNGLSDIHGLQLSLVTLACCVVPYLLHRHELVAITLLYRCSVFLPPKLTSCVITAGLEHSR